MSTKNTKALFTIKIGMLALMTALFIGCTASEKPANAPIDFASLSWPIFRGDRRLAGVAEGELGKKPALLWSFKTGDRIKASPVVGRGRVFIGSLDGKLYGLDAAGGDSLWAVDLGDDIEAPALLLDSTLYVGTLSGDFFALDAAGGAVKWRAQTDGQIYGSANWVETESGARIVIVGSYDFQMYGFDAETGARLWSYETDNYINGAPATDGAAAVFGGCDARLHIISPQTGARFGSVDTGSYIAGSAALVDGRAYLGHYGDKLICVDLAEGKIVWEYSDDGKAAAFFSSPAVNDDCVVIGSRDKRVHCVRRSDGAKLWTFNTHDDVDGSPVICGDKVVVGSSDGRLYLLSLENGALLWSYEIGAEIIGSPAVTGGAVFIGAGDGVYAFGEKR